MKRLRSLLLSIVFVLTLFLPVLSGCGTEWSWSLSDGRVLTMGKESLSENELRVLALEYKELFESYYGDLLGPEFWTMPVSKDRTFEEYVKTEYVLEEARVLLFLGAVAKERGIVLTNAEEEEIRSAAERFYGELTEDEKKFLNRDPECISKVLLRYASAIRAVTVLIDNEKVEVSDEESRVMDVMVIRLSDEEHAEELLARLRSGENFAAAAKAESENSRIEYSFSRSDLKDPVSRVLFVLKEGEISEVFSYGGSYYIFRNVSSYDALLSCQEKSNLLAVRRHDGWKDLYLAYVSEHEEKIRYSVWDRISLASQGAFSSAGSVFTCLPASFR